MQYLLLLALVMPGFATHFQMQVSSIDCEFSKSEVSDGNKLEMHEDIGKPECVAKCFFTKKCATAAYNEGSTKCSLYALGTNDKIDPLDGQVYGDINCEAVTDSGRKLKKRSNKNDTELSRWDTAGVLCGLLRLNTTFAAERTNIKSMKFSRELCFAQCQMVNCSALLYHENEKKCEIYAKPKMCTKMTRHSPSTTMYCVHQWHVGHDLPHDICSMTPGPTMSTGSTTSMTTTMPNITTTTTMPNITTTTTMPNITTTTTMPNITTTTMPNITTTTMPNITTTMPNITTTTTMPNITTTEGPCKHCCMDPCNLKVETDNGTQLTTSVCHHGKCVSMLTPDRCYIFKCECYSSSDVGPLCTPSCSMTTDSGNQFCSGTTCSEPPVSTGTMPTTTPTQRRPVVYGIMIIGGSNNETKGLTSIELFQPDISMMSKYFELELFEGRYGHVSILVESKKMIVVTGGIDQNDQILDSTEIISLHKYGSVGMGREMNKKRAFAAGAVMYDEFDKKDAIVVCGGYDGFEVLHSCERYYPDPYQFFWRLRHAMTSPRMHFVLLGSWGHLTMLAIGGINNNSDFVNFTERCRGWGPHCEKVPIPYHYKGRSGFGVVGNMESKYTYLYMAGGEVLETVKRKAKGKPKDMRWEKFGELNHLRYGTSMVEYQSKMYVIAGNSVEAQRSAEWYDEKWEKWRDAGNMLHVGRANATAIFVEQYDL